LVATDRALLRFPSWQARRCADARRRPRSGPVLS